MNRDPVRQHWQQSGSGLLDSMREAFGNPDGTLKPLDAPGPVAMMGQLASMSDYNPEGDFSDTFARRFPEGTPGPDASQAAAQRLAQKYRGVQERAGTSNLGALAESLAPTEPWQYGLMAMNPGLGLVGRAAAAIPPVARAGLGALGFGLSSATPFSSGEAKGDVSSATAKAMAKAMGSVAEGAMEIAPQVRKAKERPPYNIENWLPVTPKPYVGDEAQRVFNPGIYKSPKVVAAEANAIVAPEHPAMKALFGVTRDDLYEISKQGRREGNITDPGLFMPKKPGSNYAAEAVMNPANAQRLVDNLTEAKKFPDLARGMIPWYVMDPAFQQLVKLVGMDEAVKEYTRFNSIMTPFSASSDVMKEINRGTAARMMADKGRFPEFVKYGGMPVEKRGADFPPEMAGVIPHLRHGSTHTPAVERYLATGKHGYGDDTVKIPLYTQASGVPETGFQTRWPVPDAHFARGTGMADVRTNAGPGDFMGGSEWRTFNPWFRENVAKAVDLEAVPTQALMWGTFAPQTGVKTAIGAPKLELISQRIWERAKELGIDPARLRDQVLLGKGHAVGLGTAGGLGTIGASKMGGIAEGANEQ